MPTLAGYKKKPELLVYTARPANVGNSEVAKGKPVYIHGLPTGGDVTIADVVGLQAIITDLTDRIEQLESAAGGSPE